METETLKEQIGKFADLYGYDVTIGIIKKSGLFSFVSFAEKSIPAGGSMAVAIERLNDHCDTNVEKCIFHKNGEVTVKTDLGYLKFF